MKAILQHDERDCGPACLAMISTYYGLKMPISKYRELTKADRAGANLYGLVDGARQIGLKSEALSGTPDELMNAIYNGTIRFPFVAHVVSEGGMLHFIVIYGLKKGCFLVADPAKGKERLSSEHFFDSWTGYTVTFDKTDGFRPKNHVRGSRIKLLKLLQGQTSIIGWILLISIFVSAIGIAGSFTFQLVMDHYLDTPQPVIENVESETLTADSSKQEETVLNRFVRSVSMQIPNLDILFGGMILLYLLSSGIQMIRGYLIATLSKRIDLKLTKDYFNQVLDLPVSAIADRKTGDYLTRFSDTSTIRYAISNATITLLLDTGMVIVCGAILYLENSSLFLISFVMTAVYTVIVLIYRKPIEDSNRTVMENNAIVQSYVKESVEGIETIKASDAEKQIKDAANRKINSFMKSVFDNGLLAFSQDVLADAVELIGTAAILWYGFTAVKEGQLLVGELVTFYALLAYFTEPVKNLIELQPTLQTAKVAVDRLNDIMDLQTEESTMDVEPVERISEIEFKNVDFRYGNHFLVLKDVSMKIRRGEKVAIVGESGSGKTTIAKLLLRYYSPESGEIQINGKSIDEYNLHSLRESVAYVDQNTFLFSDTIINNLRLGNPDVTEEEIYHACRMAHAEEFIMELPMGYDTPIDENGMNLSGGQRQRLAIARALLKRPKLLILDEATSNLDTITESSIKNMVFDLSDETTCIIIAHRLSTIKNCDKIYVLEKGSIEEEGAFNDLLQRKGKLYSFWRNQ